MSVFFHPPVAHISAPVLLRAQPPAVREAAPAPAPAPARPVMAWSRDADGRLVMRWRLSA